MTRLAARIDPIIKDNALQFIGGIIASTDINISAVM